MLPQPEGCGSIFFNPVTNKSLFRHGRQKIRPLCLRLFSLETLFCSGCNLRARVNHSPASAAPAQPARKVRYAVVGLGHIAQVAVMPAFTSARNP